MRRSRRFPPNRFGRRRTIGIGANSKNLAHQVRVTVASTTIMTRGLYLMPPWACSRRLKDALQRGYNRSCLDRWSFHRLTEVTKKLLDAAGDAAVPFSFARPCALPCIVCKRQFQRAALAEAWRIGWRRHKTRATEVEITLARSLARQPQAMSQLKFGLDKVAA